MLFDKRSWCGIGLAGLGIIVYFIVGGTIGIIFLVIGLVNLVLFHTKLGKKTIEQKPEEFSEKPVETKVTEPEEEVTKEEDIV